MTAGVNSTATMAQKLELSHSLLIMTMDQIKSMSRDYSSLKPLLFIFTNSLATHLQIQNDGFFQTLKVNQMKEKSDSQMVEFLRMDLNDLRVKLFTFMEEYLKDEWKTPKKNFRRDINELLGDVFKRIEVERSYVIPYCAFT